ncbi:hypothetical protein VTH06DRAFT_4701 [Thermothelomyces fergusii]
MGHYEDGRREYVPYVRIPNGAPPLSALPPYKWEEIIYACDSSQHYGRKLQKMAYSCDSYRRHVYGPCQFDKRYDRPMTLVYSDEYCDECQRMFEYINYH